MPAGAYSPCPGGTGENIKFCCPDLLADHQKIERMLEGEQFMACLQHIDHLLKNTPDKACLLATKALLLRVLKRAEEAQAALGQVPGIRVHKAQGAFYMTVLFEPGVLNGRNRLSVNDPGLREIVERQCKGAAPDWCFVYQLLGATGICVVPLTGFYSPHPGFRFTLLETDDEKRAWTYRTLAESLVEYMESGKTAA